MNKGSSNQAVAQYFNAPQDITIHGVEFYARSFAPQSEVNIEIYLAANDSIPIGLALATATLSIDSTLGTDFTPRYAPFLSPLTVSQPYVVVFSNNSPVDVDILISDPFIGDGQEEWLASVNVEGDWVRSYNVNFFGDPLNADILLHPLVSYDFHAGFQSSDRMPHRTWFGRVQQFFRPDYF